MEQSEVVQLFEQIDEITDLIQKQLDEPYLDSLAITLEGLFYGTFNEQINDRVTTKTTERLHNVKVDTYEITHVAKAIQLAILKGMRQSTQPQHSMTPEAIALFIGYLADKLTKNLDEVRLFDPAGGTGNLLLIVMGHLTQKLNAYASEIDPTLIQLAHMSANLQKKQVEFFHQDSLQPLLLDPVDLVVADLPVGYYPDDVRASNFELKAEEGHSYAHHLFIEQSMTYTKEDGFLIFLIPDFLFESEQADQLKQYIQKYANIVGLLQLPDTAFSSKENQKSILILQKKGENTKPIKQPLLVMLPSFNDTEKMENILVQINKWFQDAGFE